LDLKLAVIGIDLNFREDKVVDAPHLTYHRHFLLNGLDFYHLEIIVDSGLIDDFGDEGHLA
jgi:hypothetical protein